MYYQTVHEKKIISGYTSRVPESSRKFVENTPVINDLYSMHNFTQNDILKQDIKEIGSSILDFYNIKYIILHENYMTEEQLKFEKNLLNEIIDDKPVYYKNDSMSVYYVKHHPLKSFNLLLGNGWEPLGDQDGVPTRWISSNNTSLFIYSDENYNATIRFTASSFRRVRTLNICNENSVISAVDVPPKFINLEVPVKLNKGENFIRFQVMNGFERPRDIPGLYNNDARYLGIAIQNLTINKI